MQKHLKVFLNLKLNFQEHFDKMLDIVNKAIGLLRKLQGILPRQSLLTIYKAFIRSHLDCSNTTMIKHTMHLFNKTLKTFNLVQSLPLQELYLKHPKKKL